MNIQQYLTDSVVSISLMLILLKVALGQSEAQLPYKDKKSHLPSSTF